MEAYHVPDTHPQFDGVMGDWNGQYDVYAGGHSRAYHSTYTPSPRMRPSGADCLSPQAVEDTSALFLGLKGASEVPPGKTARQALAQKYPRVLEKKTGADLSGYTTTEMVDQLSYFFFPNFFPWAGFGTPLLYRFRPNGNDPDSCIMEVMLMAPRPENGRCPSPAEERRLGPKEAWADAVELGGGRAAVFDQDTANIPRIQAGLKATRKSGILPSHYQEVRIRHMHHELDQYLGAGD